jgi:HSP20 family protein
MNSTLTPSETRNGAGQAERVNYLTPLANILESADGYLLEAEMPGVSKDGLDVSINNGELVILGRRGTVTPQGESLYRESRGWDYRRVFELDPSIDGSKVSARIDQGVLRLHLPKTESVKPRRIEVTE